VALLAKNCCFNCHITVLPNNALGPVGYCTSHFKRAVCISCQPRVDVHKGGWGPAHADRGGGQKPDFVVDVINGRPLTIDTG